MKIYMYQGSTMRYMKDGVYIYKGEYKSNGKFTYQLVGTTFLFYSKIAYREPIYISAVPKSQYPYVKFIEDIEELTIENIFSL